MAKRPIPDVDSAALSRLADHFPGSGEPRRPGENERTETPDAESRGRPTDQSTIDGTSGDGAARAWPGSRRDGEPGAPSAPNGAPDGGFAPPLRGGAFTPPPRPGGFTPPPYNVVPPPPPRRRQGGTLWSLLFALVALAAAMVAIAAPSLRPELRAQLVTLFPDLSQETVDFLTGQDTGRLEITYDGLDQRIAQLTETLARLDGMEALTPDQMRDLLVGETLGVRLQALEAGGADTAAQMQALSARLTKAERDQAQAAERMDTLEIALANRAEDITATLGDRIGAVRTALGQVNAMVTDSVTALGETVTVLEARVAALATDLRARETADAEQTGALAAVSSRFEDVQPVLNALRDSLDTLSSRLESVDQQDAVLADDLATLEGVVATLADDLATLDGMVMALDTTTQAIDEGLAANRQAADAVMMLLQDLTDVVGATQERRAHAENPLLGLAVLRRALNDNLPYPAAWSLARVLLHASPAATDDLLQVLDKNAATGVRTLVDLRRDFRFIATQASTPIVPDADWTDSVTSWWDYLFGVEGSPLAEPAGRQRAMVDSIDGALEAGRLDLAIEEAVMLSTRTESVLLSGWIADARQRQAVETAFAALEQGVLEGAGASAGTR